MNKLNVNFTMNTRKFLVYLILLCVILTMGLAGYTWGRFLTQPLLPKGTSLAYELKPKTSIYHFTENLRQWGILDAKKQYLFILLAYLHGGTHHLKAGEYLLEGNALPSAIIKKLVNGEVIWRRMTFLEGWNFEQMRIAIEANPYLHHLLSEATSEEIMAKLGHEGLSPEGQFFPDTYLFTRGTSDLVILKKSFMLMQTRFKQAWNHRAAGLRYQKPYQALIAASIIEKESGFKPERPLIADVLLNRWRAGMPLQIDSTVSYGLGGVVHLTKLNLKQRTPYNTYLKKGWPPTPIAMPGLDAIHAALHPRGTRFFYFVATLEQGHQFSVSLKDHYKAVAHYRAGSRKFGVSVMPYLLPDLFNNFRTIPFRDIHHES